MPESIEFWRRGIEAVPASAGFRVGLIHGPSGSGKSSLVRAGILPRLSKRVLSVYVEANTDVERTLIEAMRQAGVEVDDPASLTDLLAAVRCGRGLPCDARLLIVVDHFENWLRNHSEIQAAEFTTAMRQCDGVRVQCLLLVRDEFYTPAVRFLNELGVEPDPSRNSALVDLFELDHARRVLLKLGRSIGALPLLDDQMTETHYEFLDEVLRLVQHHNRVVPATLAMFVEYLRDKPWTSESLAALGAEDSPAVALIDDMLRRSMEGVKPKVAIRAAEGILAALMPQSEAEPTRPIRSRRELVLASGSNRTAEFNAFLDSLCRIARIATPVVSASAGSSDPSTPERGDTSLPTSTDDAHQYQLSHDSLVPLIHAWLKHKQQERWWGRHRQRTTEHLLAWSLRPRSAHLPSAIDWLLETTARVVGASGRCPPAQALAYRRMMRAATAYYLQAGAVWLLMAAVVCAPWLWYLHHYQSAERIAEEILRADARRLPQLIQRWPEGGRLLERRLRREVHAVPLDDASELEKDAAAERRSNAATALLHIQPSDAHEAWGLLKDAPDPRLRTVLIHRMAEAQLAPSILVEGFHAEKDPAVRQALLLGLGEYS
ncbi:MAG: ATP-binding protein, partial [Planctomycetes bacterium]|nr:ATP-binding protein [Planctomycetota bacterium]